MSEDVDGAGGELSDGPGRRGAGGFVFAFSARLVMVYRYGSPRAGYPVWR